MLLLAALAGEHVLLFGPSGTGKSILARRLAQLLGGDCFEHLMTPFTVPEELFGPLSLDALRRDELQRQRGYLPDAHVAILDEVFNAGPNLNSLLSLLNERQFDGRKVALWCVVGTCQELTTASDAFADRFLLRIPVPRISDLRVHDFLVSELQQSTIQDLGELHLNCQEACEASRSVHVPSRILELLRRLRAHLHDLELTISDRRLLKAVRLMQVAAYCLGATELVEVDLLILKHVLWDELPTWLQESCDVAGEEEALQSLQRCLRESQVKAATARGRRKEFLGHLGAISSIVHQL